MTGPKQPPGGRRGTGALPDEWADALADDDLYLGTSPDEFEAERRHNM